MVERLINPMYAALPHAETPRGWAQRSEKRRPDHRDIPGRNIVALIDEDQPSLAMMSVRHVAEPIVLLAHSDRTRLAAAEVAVTYRETTPNFDPERSDVSFKLIAFALTQVLLMRIGWAPCQSVSRPSSGRCSAPETMVRK